MPTRPYVITALHPCSSYNYVCHVFLSSPGVPGKVHSATPTRSLSSSHLQFSEPFGCVGYCFVIFNSSIIIALNIFLSPFYSFSLGFSLYFCWCPPISVKVLPLSPSSIVSILLPSLQGYWLSQFNSTIRKLWETFRLYYCTLQFMCTHGGSQVSSGLVRWLSSR